MRKGPSANPGMVVAPANACNARAGAGYVEALEGAAVRPLLAFVLLSASGCLVPDHTAMDSAPDAVLTFQAKLARDDVQGELNCFSQRFRQQSGGLSLQGYATLRDRFLAPLGWIGRLLLCYDSLEDNLLG